MLVILIVLILAAVAYVFVARRQTRSPILADQTPRHLNDENFRPLFAPDDEELRDLERAEADAAREKQARDDDEKKLETFEEFRQTWRKSPDRMNTIELLNRAAEMRSGRVYLETVDELLHKRPEALSAEELAELIESHFWLLPQTERTPGTTFTINSELAALRRGSRSTSDEEASDA